MGLRGRSLAVLFLSLGLATPALAADSLEQSCTAASGSVQPLPGGAQVCLCGGMRKPIDPTDPDQAQECRAKANQPIVDQLGNLNSHAVCPTCLQDGFANFRNNSCGATLLGEMLADDKTGSAFGVIDPSEKMCSQINESLRPEELERNFSGDSKYAFGAEDGVISRCLVSAPDPDKKQAIAKYYYFSNRLREADLSALESIASIDSVLGEDFKKSFSGRGPSGSDIKCSDPQMKDRTAACDFYANRCQPQGGLDQMIPQTKLALQTRDKLQAEISDLQAEDAAQAVNANYGGELVDLSPQISKKEKQIADLEAANPWIKGKVFNSTADSYSGAGRYLDEAVGKMIRKQLEQNRDSLLNRLDKYRIASGCLNNEEYKQGGLCRNFEKTLHDTPPLLLHSPDEDDRNSVMAQYFMGQAQCRWDINNAKHMTNQAFEDFAVGASLTILTAGMSSVAAGAKLAVQGVNAASGLSRAAIAGSAVFDAGFAIRGGIEGYQGCTQALNQTDALANPSTDFTGGFSCPANPYKGVAGAPNVTANMQACVTQMIAAASNLGPMGRRVISVLKEGEHAAGAANAVTEADSPPASAPNVEHIEITANDSVLEAVPENEQNVSVMTLRPSEIRDSGQIRDDFQLANQNLRRAIRSADDPADYLANLKNQIPPGDGLMRVISPAEAENIVKDGGLGTGYDFGMTPGDVRLGHNGNFIVVRCAECKDVKFADGELGSSKVNLSKIPASKLEFIVMKPGLAVTDSAVSQEVDQLARAEQAIKDPRTLPAYGLSDDQRVKKAEEGLKAAGLLKGNLTPAQRDSIRDHLGAAQDKEYFSQSRNDLQQKVINGKKAGLSIQQSDYLIRNGFAGSSRTLSTADSSAFKSIAEVKPGSPVRAQVLYTDTKGEAHIVTGNLTRDAAGNLSVQPFGTAPAVKFGSGPGQVAFGMARPFESRAAAWAWNASEGKSLSGLNSIPEGSDFVLTVKFKPGSKCDDMMQYWSGHPQPYRMTDVPLDKIGNQFTVVRRVGNTIYLRNATGWEVPVNLNNISGAASQIQTINYQSKEFLGSTMR